MRIQNYKKYMYYYVKSAGACIVIVGSCWFLYQLRQISHTLQSAVPTNILSLEQSHAQYIYIDDPRYEDVLTFRNTNAYQSSTLQKENIFGYSVTKWWKSLNRSLAYKLLRMAQNGEKSERRKAVCMLNSMKQLKDWHYRHIAQMLDANTAVALARMPKVDSRFFLEPPYYHVQHKLYDIIENVHNLLLQLSKMCNNTHPCLTQFLIKKFGDIYREGLIFDHDLMSIGLVPAPTIIWDQELLQSCVQAICHHSCLEQFCKDIINAGGLPVLMMIQKIFQNNMDVSILLAKVLSNISLHTEYLEDIFRSGWIGKLMQWSRSKDVRLAAPAGRALANLDREANEDIKYPRRIYLLHPLHRTQTAAKLDVIFLHGLLGGVFITWRQRDVDATVPGFVDAPINDNENDIFTPIIDEHPQEFLKDLARDIKIREWSKIGQDYEVILDDCPENINNKARGPYSCRWDDDCVKKSEQDRLCKTQCWPKDWLPQDVPFLRVLGVNYDTNLSMWTPLCPVDTRQSTLYERSDEYTKKLSTAGVGKRPIVWVCHSMGGLLVKRMLVEEWKNGDKHDICKNTRSIMFYSTPHRGSRVAVLKQTTQMLVWPSIEVQELREESPQLLKLHKEFLNMLKDYPMDIVSFSETKSTLVTPLKFPVQFVSSNSADPGVGEFFEIPQDHLSICKPANRQSFLYQKLLSILKRQVLTRSPETTKFPTILNQWLPRKLL